MLETTRTNRKQEASRLLKDHQFSNGADSPGRVGFLIPNLRVTGSNPVGVTNSSKDLADFTGATAKSLVKVLVKIVRRIDQRFAPERIVESAELGERTYGEGQRINLQLSAIKGGCPSGLYSRRCFPAKPPAPLKRGL